MLTKQIASRIHQCGALKAFVHENPTYISMQQLIDTCALWLSGVESPGPIYSISEFRKATPWILAMQPIWHAVFW